MFEQIENSMVVDEYWNEIEYGIPRKERLSDDRRNYLKEEFGEYIYGNDDE